jgi:hypothetical protein
LRGGNSTETARYIRGGMTSIPVLQLRSQRLVGRHECLWSTTDVVPLARRRCDRGQPPAESAFDKISSSGNSVSSVLCQCSSGRRGIRSGGSPSEASVVERPELRHALFPAGAAQAYRSRAVSAVKPRASPRIPCGRPLTDRLANPQRDVTRSKFHCGLASGQLAPTNPFTCLIQVCVARHGTSAHFFREVSLLAR